MTLVLTRVDDRLIHGQVVEGWLRVVQADFILVASDQAAADVFQTSLMRLAVPGGVEVEVLSVADAATRLKKGTSSPGGRWMLLAPGIDEIRRLIEAGVELKRVNLGGLHEAPGRVILTPSLSLSAEEKEQLRRLRKRGVAFETRVLPQDEERSVDEFL